MKNKSLTLAGSGSAILVFLIGVLINAWLRPPAEVTTYLLMVSVIATLATVAIVGLTILCFSLPDPDLSSDDGDKSTADTQSAIRESELRVADLWRAIGQSRRLLSEDENVDAHGVIQLIKKFEDHIREEKVLQRKLAES